MRIDPVDLNREPTQTLESSACLESLLKRTLETPLELEVLVEKEAGVQRRMGARLRQERRASRIRKQRKAVAKMRQAAKWRVGSVILNTAVSAAAAYFDNCSSNEMVAGVLRALNQGLGKFNPCDLKAAMTDIEVQGLKVDAGILDDEARDANDWLLGARQMERKMFDRLEAFERSRHDAGMRAIG